MTKFVYLFRINPETYRSMSPEEMQHIAQKWWDWKANLEKTGHTVSFSERLDRIGKVVRGKSKTITDGPFVEVKDIIQGFFIVQAENLEEAAQVAAGAPILEYDGTVEVRPFSPV